MPSDPLDTSDRLEKLWGHIGHMTPEQARAHIVRIRADRRVSKVKTTVKKAGIKKSDTALTELRKLITKGQEEMLMRVLKGLKNDGGEA